MNRALVQALHQGWLSLRATLARGPDLLDQSSQPHTPESHPQFRRRRLERSAKETKQTASEQTQKSDMRTRLRPGQ